MIQAVLWGGLVQFSEGETQFTLNASTIRGAIDKLCELFPEIRDELENNTSVAVNGVIYRDAWFVDLPDNAEVYFLPRVQGG